MITDNFMNYKKNNARPGSFVGLFSATGVENCYKKFGIVMRPFEVYNPGMSIPFDTLREFIK